MKVLTLIIGFIICTSSYASIECHTPRMNKTFKIEDNRITFFNNKPFEEGREVASVLGVRTKKTQNGFTKVLNFEGKKHTIHINHVNKFSDVNDYMVIKNSRGHEMTYPLTCK